MLVSLQEDLLAQLRKMEAGAEEKEKVEVRCDGLGKISTSVAKRKRIYSCLAISRAVASIHKECMPPKTEVISKLFEDIYW